MNLARGVVLVVALAAWGNAAADVTVATAFEIGLRSDSLRWNIAGDTSGQNPNILSELNWSGLMIPQGRFQLDVSRNNLHLLGALAYGQIVTGDNQDSDYSLDDRQGEYSRSNNDAGGDVWDGSIGIGYRLPLQGTEEVKHSWMPMVGLSLHRQGLTMTNGNQTISTPGDTPPLGPFAGLDSSYDADWRGGWVGARFIAENMATRVTVNADVLYHWGDYTAEANWNLRTNFVHPHSFDHRANAEGISFGLNASVPWQERREWLFGLDYSSWWTGRGTDTVYMVDGSSAQTRLNEVKWSTLSANVGLLMRF